MKPKDRVQQFVKAMAKWETWYDKKLEAAQESDDESAEDRLNKQAVEKLRAIYSEHLTEKAKADARFGGRLRSLNVSNPPQYDQKIDRVEPGKTSGSTYVYTVDRGGTDTWWRYVVVETSAGEPMIDDLRAQVGRDKKKWNLKLY